MTLQTAVGQTMCDTSSHSSLNGGEDYKA